MANQRLFLYTISKFFFKFFKLLKANIGYNRRESKRASERNKKTSGETGTLLLPIIEEAQDIYSPSLALLGEQIRLRAPSYSGGAFVEWNSCMKITFVIQNVPLLLNLYLNTESTFYPGAYLIQPSLNGSESLFSYKLPFYHSIA